MRARRKGGQRRTRHVMPLPGREPVEGGDPVRRGAQHRLCQRTACCACYSLWWRKHMGSAPIDWRQLPALGTSCDKGESHHEPEGYRGDDDDTVPLCRIHHRGGFVSRHPGNAAEFWDYFKIDYTEPRDEMRRRVEASRE